MEQIVKAVADFWIPLSTGEKTSVISVLVLSLGLVGSFIAWLLRRRQKLRVRMRGIDKNLSGANLQWSRVREANDPSKLMLMCLKVKSACDVRIHVKGYVFTTETTNDRQNRFVRLCCYFWDGIRPSQFSPILPEGDDVEPASTSSDWKEFRFPVQEKHLPFRMVAVAGTWRRRWKVPSEDIVATNKILLEDLERLKAIEATTAEFRSPFLRPGSVSVPLPKGEWTIGWSRHCSPSALWIYVWNGTAQRQRCIVSVTDLRRWSELQNSFVDNEHLRHHSMEILGTSVASEDDITAYELVKNRGNEFAILGSLRNREWRKRRAGTWKLFFSVSFCSDQSQSVTRELIFDWFPDRGLTARAIEPVEQIRKLPSS